MCLNYKQTIFLYKSSAFRYQFLHDGKILKMDFVIFKYMLFREIVINF